MTYKIEYRIRWWVLPYLRLMDHLQNQCGVQIDADKVRRRMLSGISVIVGGKEMPLAYV